MFWFALALLVISTIIKLFIAPASPDPPKPATFDEFKFPQIDDGTPQLVFFGENWVPAWFVLGVGNYRNRPIMASAGGKK